MIKQASLLVKEKNVDLRDVIIGPIDIAIFPLLLLHFLYLIQ